MFLLLLHPAHRRSRFARALRVEPLLSGRHGVGWTCWRLVFGGDRTETTLNKETFVLAWHDPSVCQSRIRSSQVLTVGASVTDQHKPGCLCSRYQDQFSGRIIHGEIGSCTTRMTTEEPVEISCGSARRSTELDDQQACFDRRVRPKSSEHSAPNPP